MWVWRCSAPTSDGGSARRPEGECCPRPAPWSWAGSPAPRCGARSSTPGSLPRPPHPLASSSGCSSHSRSWSSRPGCSIWACRSWHPDWRRRSFSSSWRRCFRRLAPATLGGRSSPWDSRSPSARRCCSKRRCRSTQSTSTTTPSTMCCRLAVAVIYLVAVILGGDYLGFLAWIPGISRGLIERVTGRLADQGLPYTPLLVFGGVPLKLYSGVAFSLGLSLGPVLLWTGFARLVRIAPTFAAAAATRLLLRRRIDARATAWCAVLGGVWCVFYLFYFSVMRRA